MKHLLTATTQTFKKNKIKIKAGMHKTFKTIWISVIVASFTLSCGKIPSSPTWDCSTDAVCHLNGTPEARCLLLLLLLPLVGNGAASCDKWPSRMRWVSIWRVFEGWLYAAKKQIQTRFIFFFNVLPSSKGLVNWTLGTANCITDFPRSNLNQSNTKLNVLKCEIMMYSLVL